MLAGTIGAGTTGVGMLAGIIGAGIGVTKILVSGIPIFTTLGNLLMAMLETFITTEDVMLL